MSNARLRRRYRHPPWYSWREDHCLVAVDLGKRKVGVALFGEDGVLIQAKTIHTQRGTPDWNPHTTADAVLAWVCENAPLKEDWVCEWPAIRPKDKNASDVRTLLQVGNSLEQEVGKWREKFVPSEWKRNVGKDLHHQRLRAALDPEEQEMWDRLGHDARDAVGIGLFALGRTDCIGRAL